MKGFGSGTLADEETTAQKGQWHPFPQRIKKSLVWKLPFKILKRFCVKFLWL